MDRELSLVLAQWNVFHPVQLELFYYVGKLGVFFFGA